MKKLDRYKLYYETSEHGLEIWRDASQRLKVQYKAEMAQIVGRFSIVFARVLVKVKK